MYDAIVIGGRISGSSTAMLLARQGHRVVLLEKKKALGETLSTHFIWPRGMSYLNRWGLAETLLAASPSYRDMEFNIEGISLVGQVTVEDLETRFEALHGDSTGVIDRYCGPRRRFLDNVLLDAARESGVETQMGFDVTGPIIDDGVVVGVRGRDASGRERELRARIVIGASGRFSKFADQVGSLMETERPKSTFAYFSYYTGIDREELAIHKRGRLGTAIYPTMDDKQMVLVYGPNAWWDDFRRDAETNFLRTFDYCAPEVAPLVRQGERQEKFYACGTMTAFKRQVFGPGWALVGDAASFKDQVTAMGITHALRDAELISGYIHRALGGELDMPQALERYAKVRSADYDEYFDYVCRTAEMNIITPEELELYASFAGDGPQIDRMVGYVGDTVPAERLVMDDRPPAALASSRLGLDHAALVRGYERGIYRDGASVAASR